jgi:hypothetical protein
LHDLGVAGDHLHAGVACRQRHRPGDAMQHVERQAFLDDRGARQIERNRATDRQIIDCAAHGEFADIAAGKFKWIDNEGVGGDRQPVASLRQCRHRHACLVVERRKQRVVEGGDEHFVDQVLHCLAAATVAERHCPHAAFAA